MTRARRRRIAGRQHALPARALVCCPLCCPRQPTHLPLRPVGGKTGSLAPLTPSRPPPLLCPAGLRPWPRGSAWPSRLGSTDRTSRPILGHGGGCRRSGRGGKGNPGAWRGGGPVPGIVPGQLPARAAPTRPCGRTGRGRARRRGGGGRHGRGEGGRGLRDSGGEGRGGGVVRRRLG